MRREKHWTISTREALAGISDQSGKEAAALGGHQLLIIYSMRQVDRGGTGCSGRRCSGSMRQASMRQVDAASAAEAGRPQSSVCAAKAWGRADERAAGRQCPAVHKMGTAGGRLS